MTNKDELFEKIKDSVIAIDPVAYCEKYLTLDGKPFRLRGNGYKPFVDIYRYIGIKALDRDAKPVILVKARQIGATTMAAALEMYFMTCGLFGGVNRPPMRLMHCFPQLELAYVYSKTKLKAMISSSILIDTAKGKKPFVSTMLDTSTSTNDSLNFKQFMGGNHLFVESLGLTADRVRGRQLALDTEIPTPNGFVKLGDIKEGDELFDEKGKVCRVTKLHPISLTPEAYEIVFDDGARVEACAEHLWLTHTKGNRRAISNNKKIDAKIKNTKEILKTLKVAKTNENNHSIPTCLPVEYSKKELLIDPYLFGLWLGDGSRNGHIETADPEILSNYEHRVIKSTIGRIGSFSKKPSRSCTYNVKGLTTKLTKLEILYNPGPTMRKKTKGFYNKHIPQDYMHSSTEQRLALLQGLMDSGGCVYKDGRCDFTQVRKELSYQVYELISSLGIKASIRKKKSMRYGVRYQDKHVILFMTDLPVFRLKRKLNKMQSIKRVIRKSRDRFIKNIKPIKTKPMRCITVDSPSHLYLITKSFIPTHNSIDCFFADECQDLRGLAIGNAIKTLSQSKYGKVNAGIQVYFGTPKQRGTEYWKLWNKSSQQYYYLGCEKCKEYFCLYTPGTDEWEQIWLYGMIVKCTHCGQEQDKLEAAERGKWIAHNKDEDGLDYIGYHINQLYMPLFTKEDILSQKPERNPLHTERIYQNEVLGEFFAGDASPITPEEIEEKCADRERKMRRNIVPSSNVKVYLGCDWGAKADISQLAVGERARHSGGQSYSCSVVLSADGPHILSIDFATRLKRNDLATKMGTIEEIMRRYSVDRAVGDIGFANDLTELLQKEYGNRFIASQAASRVNGRAKFKKDFFPNTIVFEKDYYYAEVYDLMKSGRIRFPFGDYEKILWLIDHCCSMELKPTRDRSGEIGIRYVKGATPNDGFAALVNAYIAYKFDITEGFSISNPNLMRDDPKKRPEVLAIAAYLPGLSPGGRRK